MLFFKVEFIFSNIRRAEFRYYTEEQYQLPAIEIRESDLFGVYLAEKLLVQYEGSPIYDSLCSVFNKIEASLPDKISMDPATEQAKFTVIPPFSTTIDAAVWETMINCLRSSQQVKIQYKNTRKRTGDQLGFLINKVFRRARHRPRSR
ncbi:hypothetical protein [Desulfogranum marinum]|uniref:hypothetical protein n=1 Tax=Desulfogranum marinum TaxID=453220 RepID=UPI0019658A8A|nr:hypothetical protein [Desulfogranum marinum]MBM9513358.1 hypothetical protein [Desulfogranum marinum]